MTRKELNDRQAKHDAFISNLGQKEAARYLSSKGPKGTRRADMVSELVSAFAFLLLVTTVTIILLSL